MLKKVTGERCRGIWKKYKYVLLVLAAGVGLLLLPTGKKTGTESRETVQTEDEKLSVEDTEEKMEKILTKIHGVGNLQLMLTLDSNGETQLAEDTETSYTGKSSSPEDYDRKSQTVVVSGDNGEETVVTKTSGPVYRGALVVCQGAGNAEVKLAVTQAVAALTGLSSDRITVVKCQ